MQEVFRSIRKAAYAALQGTGRMKFFSHLTMCDLAIHCKPLHIFIPHTASPGGVDQVI
jgi:hypothetical protein